MSDENDPKREQPDDDSDLDQLEDGDDGFDRAVAQARGVDPATQGERPYTQEEAGLRSRVGWGRSPIVAVAVIVVGAFLLSATWADFRYFLRSLQSAPRELGQVGDIYQDGEFTERFDNEWVVLNGDPDVQHAARMPGREGWIGFMRLMEADASLFVAVPRAEEKISTTFAGRFEGRMRRISDVPQWERLQVFFNAEEINDTIDLTPPSVVSAAIGGVSEVEVAGGGGSLTLAANDKLRVIVNQPYAMVQLGRTTWPTREAAEATMQVFGRPWVFVEKRDAVWVYALDIDANAKVELFQDLTKALNGGDTLASADPKVGGLVLPRRATFRVEFGDLQADTAELSFTYAGNTAETGYRVEGQTLVPVELERGRLSVPVDAIADVRLERPLVANPDGYLLLVGQKPTDVWPSAVMFLAVFGVVALNGWALVKTLRRRRDEAEA